MYQEERLFQIMEELRSKGFLSKGEIMEMFQISRDTARRDIISLTSQGLAIRTYGGITLPNVAVPAPFKARYEEEPMAKDKLGKLATAYIRENSQIFLDTSTTVESICPHLKEKTVIYTNSIDNVTRLSGVADVEAHLVGGKLHERYRYLYGKETLEQLSKMKFDICFLGASSINAGGVYTYDPEDAAIKQMVVRQSSLVCVLVANKKFLNQGDELFCKLEDVDVVLTSAIPPKKIIKALAEANCSIIWDV